MTRRANDCDTIADNLALRIVLLVDGAESETLARNIYKRLCARLPGEGATRLSVWRFESLNNGRTQRTVDHDIKEADVVMVAADGSHPLPGGIETALERWLLGSAAARFGLVEILHGISEEAKEGSQAHIFLENLASKAGTEFLSHVVSQEEIFRQTTVNTPWRGTMELVWNEEFASSAMPVRRWGLNE